MCDHAKNLRKLSAQNLELECKHQRDITMSQDDEQKSPKPQGSNLLTSAAQPKATTTEDVPTVEDRQEKTLELLKKLRSFVSNPAPDFKSKINNIITPATKAIEKYKGNRDKNI